ncbi:copper chaperone PCu(A)C [Streptomonospora wellingtoniae]|uniref:Copper chaperone PCu(A)C n=1 Tax=Streptomonospora wellingtoniae TaxID=3075544 RepID=A0ABU2L0Z0_9ACTN|nr:copper chaperone PCu(A)C [Streptomonospora sp. DSM 45055]MDT0304928.1 copper chaperone PCu(A)C [Streptomonospora sp. DSM 45055]
MTPFTRRTLAFAAAGTAALALAGCGQGSGTGASDSGTGAPSGAGAGDARKGSAAAGDLKVGGAWIPEPANPATAAGYLSVRNSGDRDDALVGAETSAAATTEVHTTATSDSGAKTMEEVERAPVPAGGELVLESGSYHLMLMELPEDLSAGDTVTLTLHFDSGTDVDVDAPVLARS